MQRDRPPLHWSVLSMTEENRDPYEDAEDGDEPLEGDDVEGADSPEDSTGASGEHDADGTLVSQKADDLAEAERLTVTAKLSQRQQLEEEVARFLAQGGRIVEVPPDETAAHD